MTQHDGDERDEREELGEILWTGRQWAVTEFGLETLDRDIAYSVPVAALGRKTYGSGGPGHDTDEPETLRHLCGKQWTDVEDLITGFSKALEIHDGKCQPVTAEGLAKGIAFARRRYALREIVRGIKKLDGRRDESFASLVDEFVRDGLVHGDDAQVEWSDDDNGRIDKVEVFSKQAYAAGHRRLQHGLENSAGAIGSTWQSGEYRRDTPAGIYAQWLLAGFTSPLKHLSALRELGKIAGQDWALELGAAMAEHLAPRLYGEEIEDE
jgi:hypothetical protein